MNAGVKSVWVRLAHSRKFWLAVVAMAQSIVFSLVPSFPKELWLSIDAVLGIVIGSIAIEDAAANASIKHLAGEQATGEPGDVGQ